MAENDVVIKIGADASKAAEEIISLTSALKQLKTASAGGFSNLEKASAAINTLSASLAKVGSASASIKTLASGIAALNAAQKGISGSGLSKLATHIEALSAAISKSAASFGAASSIASMINTLKESSKGVSSAGLKNLASALESISVGLSGITANEVARLQSLAAALSGFTGIKISKSAFNGLERLPEIIKSFSGLNLTSFISQMQKLSAVLDPFAKKVERLATAFSKLPPHLRSASSAARSVTNANKTLNNITGVSTTKAAGQTRQFNLLYRALNKTSASLKAYTSRLRISNSGVSTSMILNTGLLVTAVYALSRAFSSCIENVNEYIESMNLAQTVMGTDVFTQAAGTLNGISFESDYDISTGTGNGFWTKAQEVMGIDSGQAIKYQAVFEDIITGMGVARTSAAKMSQQLTQLGYDISSFNNISVSDAMTKIQSGISGELEPMRRIGYDLSVARLQQDALTAGIEGQVSQMTQAEKVQLRYYEMMSQITEAHGDLARTLNSPANQIRVLSAQVQILARNFGALLLPALNSIVPVLTAIIKLANQAISSLAALFGVDLSSYLANLSTVDYSSMADQAEDTADALDSASGSAAELKNQLMGFDEINKMDDVSDSGSGSSDTSSGGGGSLDLDSLSYNFFDGLAASNVNDILESLQTALEGGDWYGIGVYIASRINAGVSTILTYMPTIQAKVREGAKNLADFLNGLFSSRNFAFTIGDFIAEGLNTIALSALAFYQEFDWSQFGTFAANGLNATFLNINYGNISAAFITGLDGVIQAAQSFVDNVSYVFIGANLGQTISDCFTGIDFAGIAKVLVTGVNGVTDGLRAAFANMNLGEMGYNLAQGINDIFTGIDFGSLGSVVAEGLMQIVDMIVDFFLTLDIQSVIESVNTFLNNAITGVNWVEVGTAIGYFIGDVAQAIVGIIFNLETWINIATAILDALVGAIGGLFSSGGLLDFLALIFPAEKIVAFAGDVFKGVAEPVISAITGIGEGALAVVDGALGTAKAAVETIWNGILKVAGTISDGVTSFFKGVADFLGSIFKEPAEKVKKIFETIGNVVDWLVGSAENVIRTAILFVLNIFDTMYSVINNTLQNVYNFFASIFSSIGTFVGNILNKIGNVITSVFTTAKNFIGSVGSAINSIFQNVGNTLGNVFTGIWNTVSSIFNNIKSFISTVASAISTVFNNVWSTFKNGVSGAWNAICSVFGQLATFFYNIFSTAWSRITSIFQTGSSLFTNFTNGIVSTFKKVVNWVIGGINNVVAVPFNAINSAINSLRGIDIVGIQPFSWLSNISVPQIPYLATGGQVSTGQLFVARESGAELVGQMGNKTTVANNDQIVEGIENGVFSAMMQALPYFTNNNNNNQNGGGDVTLILQVGNEELARAVQKGSSSLARRGAIKTGVTFA